MLSEPIIDKVFNAVLKATGLEEKISRNERVIRFLQRFGLDSLESLRSFEDAYAYAVVQYAFDTEGRRKPTELIQLFRLKEVRDVFKVAYRENDGRSWLEKGQAIARYRLKDTLPGTDPERELSEFAVAFVEVVKETRSPKEIRQEQKLDSLQRQIQSVQTQIQQLPTLEAINQTLGQLSGAEVPALPAVAQTSQAAELAHRLGEWFEVLEYDRDPDYEVWTPDYFEWGIDFPVTRRRMSRTLVRGIAGEAEMGDLQAFAQAVAAANADEGWLVANRRVSRAVRNSVQAEDAYDAISCYTFDELLDEDADFSKYLDWLENEIKAKGIDAGYLPLACRKDELDPASGRKIGVSTYAEEDGWIEGYVDMWLDDPAKEHLSILGEFGTGKTWFALHYAWVALQRYRLAKQRGTERPRIPVVVPLRDYAEARSVKLLFSDFFFRRHEILKNYSVFEQLNRMGKLLLIFDGFDEMTMRVDRQQMIDNFWELAKVVVPGAKAILTCRTEHFPDARQGLTLLSADLKGSTKNLEAETPQFEVLELEKLSDAQIRKLLSRNTKTETVQQVVENDQLLDLARRPVMVDLILEALPDIEAGKPVDMARVYLYAVTRKMEKDIRSERTFTSMADKLCFLCELSWEMLSTNRMSLNYRDFPERLEQMFADRVKEEKELDHWRYDMMGQTMLIRNSEGDYSPAHRSLLEFFAAYKIVASLGTMAEDFTAVAKEQSYLDESLPARNYSWNDYFRRECSDDSEPVPMARLSRFAGLTFNELLPLLRQAKLSKAVLDLAHPMLDEETMREQLLPLLQATASISVEECSYFGGNIIQMMLAKTPHALTGSDLSDTKLQGIEFAKAFLRQVNLQRAWLSEVGFSKVLDVVNSIAYHPTAPYMAIGDSKGILQVWNVAIGQVFSFCEGHKASINSLVYNSNGQQFASASDDNTVKLWNSTTGDCIRTLKGHKNSVRSVAYSPDGQRLASASDDNTVKLWNSATGDCIRTLKGHKNSVRSVAYSPDGQRLASASDDNTVKLWNSTTGDCIRTLKGHKNSVRSVVYSPDGQRLASASNDNTVKIWDLTTGDCIQTLKEQENRVRSIAYRPDGRQLASSNHNVVKLWDPATGDCVRALEGHKNSVRSLVYSPDGQQLASGGGDNTVKLWDSVTGDCIRTLEGYENSVRILVYSPDGQQLASGSYDNTVKLWDPATGNCIQTPKSHKNWVRAVAYSPDGQQLASGSADNTVKLWDSVTGDCIRTLEGHKNWVRSVAFSPEGQQLASGGSDNTVRLWNLSTGDCIRTLKGHENSARSVVYSPDGQQLASGSHDNTVRVWDPATGDCVQTLEGHKNWVRSVVYSPDGQQLASGSFDSTVRIWDPVTGDCIQTLKGHENRVRSVVYSPDGQQLASASYDDTVKLWNPATGDCIRTLKGHKNSVRSVAYSPDGQQLASGGADNTILIWDVHTGECLRVIDDRVCAGLKITDTIGLTSGQRTALKLMGAIDHNDE